MSQPGDAQTGQLGQSATISQKYSELSEEGERTMKDHEFNEAAIKPGYNTRNEFEELFENQQSVAEDIESDNDSLFNTPTGTEIIMSPVIDPATFSQLQFEGMNPPQTAVWPQSSLKTPINTDKNLWMLSPGATELPHDNFGWQVYNSTCPLAPTADSDPSYWEIDPQFDSYLLRKAAGDNPDAEYLNYEPAQHAELARIANLQPFRIEDIPSDEDFIELGNSFADTITDPLFDGVIGKKKFDPLLFQIKITEQSQEEVLTANRGLQVEELNTTSSGIGKGLQCAENQEIVACNSTILTPAKQGSNIQALQTSKRTTHVEESSDINAASHSNAVSILSKSYDIHLLQTPNTAAKVISSAQDSTSPTKSQSNNQLSVSGQATVTRKATQSSEIHNLDTSSVQSVARIRGRKEDFWLRMDPVHNSSSILGVDSGNKPLDPEYMKISFPQRTTPIADDIRLPNGFLPPGMYATKPQKHFTVKEGPFFSDIELQNDIMRSDMSVGRTAYQDEKSSPKRKRPVLLPSALSPSDPPGSSQTRRVNSQTQKHSASMKRARQDSNTWNHESMKRVRASYTPTPQHGQQLEHEESTEKVPVQPRGGEKKRLSTAPSTSPPQLLEAQEYFMAELLCNIPSSGIQEAGWTRDEAVKMKLSNEFLQHTAQMGKLTENCTTLNLQFLLAQDSGCRDGRAYLEDCKVEARELIDSELYGAAMSSVHSQFQREVVDSTAFQHLISYHLVTLAKLAGLRVPVPTNDTRLERARRSAGCQTRAMDKQLRDLRNYAKWVQDRALRAMEEPNAKKFMKIAEENRYLVITSLKYISNYQYESIMGGALNLDAAAHGQKIHEYTLEQYTPLGKNGSSSMLLEQELAASPVLRNMSKLGMPPRARSYSQSIRRTSAVGQNLMYRGGNNSRSQNEYSQSPLHRGPQQQERLYRPQTVSCQGYQNQIDLLARQRDQNNAQINSQMISQMSNQAIMQMSNEPSYANGQHRGMQMRHHPSHMGNQILQMSPQNSSLYDDSFQMPQHNPQMQHAQMGHNQLQMQQHHSPMQHSQNEHDKIQMEKVHSQMQQFKPQMPYVSSQMLLLQHQHKHQLGVSHDAQVELNRREMDQLYGQMNNVLPQMTVDEQFQMLNAPSYTQQGRQYHGNAMQQQQQTPTPKNPARSGSPQQFYTPNSGVQGQNYYGNASSPAQFQTPQGRYRSHSRNPQSPSPASPNQQHAGQRQQVRRTPYPPGSVENQRMSVEGATMGTKGNNQVRTDWT